MTINEKALIALAQKTIKLEAREREEVIWLQNKYKEFCENTGMNKKAEADALLYERMYAKLPDSSAALTKIRFWRTGRHLPMNRNQMTMLGKALELSPDDMKYLVTAYWDHSDQVFSEMDKDNSEYTKRMEIITELLEEYFMKVHPSRRIELNITKDEIKHNLRHLYFTDSFQYISGNNERLNSKSHIVSVNYGSELLRNMRLFGEIPRKTMIRHLIILGLPFINIKIINERLRSLGYVPLSETHRLTTGESLDYLLIHFLKMYEENCQGLEPEECVEWFQTSCKYLDGYFAGKELDNYRFMYYKALDMD